MGSNPAQGTKSFYSDENVFQRVVRPWSPLNSIYIYIYIYIYIIRGRAGYELIYITNEAVSRVGYYQHVLLSMVAAAVLSICVDAVKMRLLWLSIICFVLFMQL